MLSARVLCALTAAAALALSGCGDENEAASALDEALGFLPQDSGFAFVASTDTDDYSEVEDLLEKFPFGGQVKDRLKGALAGEGVDFDDDVKPLLGNYLVIGAADNASFVDSRAAGTPFVMALETKDKGKLGDLAKKDTESKGESEGYDIYQGQQGDTWLAVKDEVLVLSNDGDTLRQALKQRGEDDRLTEEDVEAAFEDLPEDAPLRAYVNVKALLAADPEAKEALKIKWVDHIETLGLSAVVTDDRVSLDYALRTDPEGLTEADLPLASGPEAPQVFEREDGSAEIVFGLREPAQLVEFGLAAAQVVDPAGFGQFEVGKQQIGKRLGIDVDEDVIGQLTGDLAAVVTLDEQFGIRAGVEDPAAFEKTLAKVMDGLPQYAEGITITKPGKGERLYGIATEDGQSYALGVADGAFVLANDAGLAGEVATRGLVDVEGVEGAFVMTADAEQIANEAFAKFSSGLQSLGASLFTGPLGQVTSSAESSTDGISGSLELGID